MMNILVPYLSSLRSDIKSILSLTNLFAGDMHGSEAQKTKDEKELKKLLQSCDSWTASRIVSEMSENG